MSEGSITADRRPVAEPLTLAEANEFVRNFHRHNRPVTGHLFSVGASDGTNLVGVAIASRPVARRLDDGYTVEVVRCCVVETAPKGTCSFLYAACWRAAQALGYKRAITYTLTTESGASMRGAGWKPMARSPGWEKGKGWTTRAGRDWQPVVGQQKIRWEAV